MKNRNANAVFCGEMLLSLLLIALTVGVLIPSGTAMGERLNGLPAQAPVTEIKSVNIVKTENKTTTLSNAPGTPVLKEPETTAAVSAKETELSDLKKMQEEYAAAFAGQTPIGTVSTECFVTQGATDVLGNVAIKNATAAKKPDFAALLNAGAPLEKAELSAPTVLVFHTHTTESYLQVDDGVFHKGYETRSEDPARNMVRVGDELCRVLEENGIGVLHDTNIYDKSYNGAYARSRVTVLDYLAKYPTIQVVLDVHRDAIYYSDTSHCKPTAVINGEKAAQVMIITGAEEGQITDFPHWEENLRFALALQKEAQERFEGLMRPVYFCQRKYNMDTAKCSLLLEIGSDANTLEEACRSAHMIGEALTALLKGT